MAFDRDIGGVQNRVQVRDPGPRLSLFEGLATVGSAAVGALTDRNRRRAAEAEAERAAQEEALRDRVERTFFADRATGNRAARGGSTEFENRMGFDGVERVVPVDVQESVSELSRLEQGREQGRVSNTQFRTRLETEVARIMRDHPDMASEIATYMREQGLDHYMFRELQAQEADQEARAENRRKQEDEAFNAAIDNYSAQALSGLTYEQQVQLGQDFIRNQNIVEAARAAAAEQRALNAEQRAQNAEFRSMTNFQQAQNDRTMGMAAQALISNQIQPLMLDLQQRIASNELGPGEDRAQALRELRAIINEARATAVGTFGAEMSPAAFTQLNQQFDRQQEMLDFIITSDNPKEILDTFENRVGLNLSQAVPGLAAIREVMGEQFVSNAFSPAMMAYLTQPGPDGESPGNALAQLLVDSTNPDAIRSAMGLRSSIDEIETLGAEASEEAVEQGFEPFNLETRAIEQQATFGRDPEAVERLIPRLPVTFGLLNRHGALANGPDQQVGDQLDEVYTQNRMDVIRQLHQRGALPEAERTQIVRELESSLLLLEQNARLGTLLQVDADNRTVSGVLRGDLDAGTRDLGPRSGLSPAGASVARNTSNRMRARQQGLLEPARRIVELLNILDPQTSEQEGN